MLFQVLILGGVGLLSGAVALHLDPFALVQGFTRWWFPARLFQSLCTAAAVGCRTDGHLSHATTRNNNHTQSNIIQSTLNVLCYSPQGCDFKSLDSQKGLLSKLSTAHLCVWIGCMFALGYFEKKISWKICCHINIYSSILGLTCYTQPCWRCYH